VAFGVVGFELLAISFIRYRYFDMSFVVSAFQVCVGGALVFLAGIMIGSV
jgi:erythrin-vacuolar iron transport family protein